MGVLEGGQAQGEGTSGVGPLPRTEAGPPRNEPQGCLCLRHLPVVLLSSAWTKLSIATLLASNRLWPSSAAVRGVLLFQEAIQGPSLGLPKPLKYLPLGPQPDLTPRGLTAAVSVPTPTLKSQHRW